MFDHHLVILDYVMGKIDRLLCAYLPQDILRIRVDRHLRDAIFRSGMDLQDWEHTYLTSRLMNELPGKHPLVAA